MSALRFGGAFAPAIALVIGISQPSVAADKNELVTDPGTDRIIWVSALEIRRSTDTVEVPDWQKLDAMPILKLSNRPVYPEGALTSGVEDSVWISALVDAAGIVQRAVVKKPSQHGLQNGFELTALEAAMANVFDPATRDGQPMAAWISYPVEFRIKK